MELLNLGQLIRNKQYIQIPENRRYINPIPYNPEWILYYYEYEALKSEDQELKAALNSFFNNAIRVNTAIKNGQIETANKINESYIDHKLYSISKYSEWEVITCLRASCNDFHF